MKRRTFLATILAAPVAVKAASVVPYGSKAEAYVAPEPEVGPYYGIQGQVVYASGIQRDTYTYSHLEDPYWPAEEYSRSYAIRVCGPEGRIVKVWRNGKEIEIDGKVRSIRNGTLYAEHASVTDTQGRIPDYMFAVVRA